MVAVCSVQCVGEGLYFDLPGNRHDVAYEGYCDELPH